MSSSRNRLNKTNNQQLTTSTKQTSTSSNKRVSLILSDLCLNNPSTTQRKSVTTMADTEIGNSKVSNIQSKRYSIYTSENLEIIRDRYDANGNPIFKGSKNHKVTFIDDVDRKNIAEIILVESENSTRNKIKQTEQVMCQCETGCFIY